MIWMWGPTSPTLISFFTLHLSWHPGSCFSSRATFYHLSPWRQSGSHQKSERFTQSNHFISTPQLQYVSISMWHILVVLSGNFFQTQMKMWLLMTLNSPWNIWWLTQSSSKSQSDFLSQCIPPQYYSFDWSGGTQNLAASVKLTVIKLFKNGTAGEIMIQNDTRLLEIIFHRVW